MSFSISIIKNPIYVWDERRQCKVINWSESRGDHNLDFAFDHRDFIELQNFLDVKLPPIDKIEGEDYIEYNDRIKDKYVDKARERGYQMLGRIWDWYDSVIYLPNEIKLLLEECLKLKEKSQNSYQLVAINKLIMACKEALKTDSGIFLGSD